jgi:hypothetical protein
MDTTVKDINDIDIKQHSFILICSKRASGKTVLNIDLIKNLLDKYEYDNVILFSQTAQFNKDYDFLDRDLIFKCDDMDDKLSKILKIQERNIKNDKIVNLLIILDDVQLHKKSKLLIDLSTLGRHFKITCIASVQYPKTLINSSIRHNLDYIIFSDLGELALKAIYECIHIKMNFKEFQEFVNNNNHNYQFIFYNGRTQNRNDRISVIKAKTYNNIKLLK